MTTIKPTNYSDKMDEKANPSQKQKSCNLTHKSNAVAAHLLLPNAPTM
jgi:hypothetical protein